MPDEPYTDPHFPAHTVNELLDYLRQRDDGHFAYRGQVKDYPGPLVPSVYRGILTPEPFYDLASPEYRFSLRKIGRRFVGNFSKSFAESISCTFLPDPHTGKNQEFELLMVIQNDHDIASRIVSLGFKAVIESILPTDIFKKYRSRLDIWQRHIDSYHRIVIRNNAFLSAFGYLIGEALAQQFGLSSEALDATTDINVAAFYATHLPVSYLRIDSRVAKAHALDLGVIYRFPLLPGPLLEHYRDHRYYYRAPGTVVLDDLLSHLEVPHCTVQDSLKSFKEFYDIHTATGEREIQRLRLPVGSIANSRIGRQRAALIIPDELRIEKPPPFGTSIFGKPTIEVGKQGIPVLSAIEDIRYREGVFCYYFCHSDEKPANDLTPSYLWPNSSDILLRIVLYILMGKFEVCHEPPFIVPPRIDLIDPGFGAIDFDTLLKEISDYTAQFDSLENILLHATKLQSIDGHLYLVRKAASLCYQGHVEASAEKLNTALALCQKASELDNDSVVLALLEHIIYITLGDRGENYARSWAKAMKLAGEAQDFVMEIFRSLFYMRFDSKFPHYLYEYYQSF